MSSKMVAERNQRTLLELVTKPGNDICADCKARNPRWASHNLGIFICVRCASIHRKIGTHITKVKSLTMDSWSKEQVEVMKQYGNNVSNSYYNPNETKHPPPVNSAEAERDSELEKFIRDKYEFKSFIPDKSAIAARLLGPSQSVASRLAAQPKRAMTTSPSLPTTSSNISQPQGITPSPSAPPAINPPTRSATQPFLSTPSAISSTQPAYVMSQQAATIQPQQQLGSGSGNPVWNDLVSLQAPSLNPSLPLQFSQPSAGGLLASSGAGFVPGTSPSMLGGLSPPNPGFTPGASPDTLGGMAFNNTPSMVSPPMNTGMAASNPFQQLSLGTTSSLGGTGLPGNPFTGMTGASPFQQQQPMGSQQPFTGLQTSPFGSTPTQFQAQPTGNPFASMVQSPFPSQGMVQPPQQGQLLQTTGQFAARSPSPGAPMTGGLGSSLSSGVGQGMLSSSPGMMMGVQFGGATPGTNPGMSAPANMGTQGVFQAQQPFGQQQQPFGQQQQPFGQQQQPFGQQQQPFGQQQQQPFGQQQQPFGQQQTFGQQQPFGQQPFGQAPQLFGNVGGMSSNNPFGQGWQGGQHNWGGA